MPTTYQASGTAIERAGPHERGLFFRTIAYCDSDRTARMFCEALRLVEISYHEEVNPSAAVVSLLTMAGII